jgi:ATP-dependent Clp protease ATP-binding subunit ClpC
LKDFGLGVGFNTAAKEQQADDYAKGVIEKALKNAFAPEFLNRIDDVVLFNNLKKEDIHKIIDIELSALYKRVLDMGYKVTLSDEAKNFIAEKGFDEKYGARPLKRAIQKYLEDPMAEEIIKANIDEGDELKADLNAEKGEIFIKVKKAKAKKQEDSKEDGPTKE